MSLSRMKATNRAARRPDARRHRPHLESLEGRVALSTLAGREAVPVAAIAPVSGSRTPYTAVDRIGSPAAIHQQEDNVNTVEIQNLLPFNLFVVAHLKGTNSRVTKRLLARPGPIQEFQFLQREPRYIAIDIQRQGGGSPDPRHGVELIRPSMRGYFNPLYWISLVHQKFSVSRAPASP